MPQGSNQNLRLLMCMSEIGLNIIRKQLENVGEAKKITVFLFSLLTFLGLVISW